MNRTAEHLWADDACHIASCPEHGVHGQRDVCYDCGGPVERLLMVPAAKVAVAWRALERQRDRWIQHALGAALTAYSLRRQLSLEFEHTRRLLAALKDIEGGAAPRETAMRALRAYTLRNVVLTEAG